MNLRLALFLVLSLVSLSGLWWLWPKPAQPVAAAAKPAVASAEPAVDARGVPAWAKRKRLRPVQSCETRPNIGIETWRTRYDAAAPERLKPRPATATCH